MSGLDGHSINPVPCGADNADMGRIRDQRGFTLIELLVVILIIGILAAVALPLFLGQRAKAQDAAAKSDARNLMSQLEACYTARDRYDGCPGPSPAVPIGLGSGESQVRANGDSYEIVARSGSGNSFTIAKVDGGAVSRTCDGAAEPGGGCRGGTW